MNHQITRSARVVQVMTPAEHLLRGEVARSD